MNPAPIVHRLMNEKKKQIYDILASESHRQGELCEMLRLQNRMNRALAAVIICIVTISPTGAG
jgi:hypothetical protein